MENNTQLPSEGAELRLNALYMIIAPKPDGSWGLCQNSGSSTRTRPMIYDDIRAAHRAIAHCGIKGAVLAKINNLELSYE